MSTLHYLHVLSSYKESSVILFVLYSVAQSYLTLCDAWAVAHKLPRPWNFQVKNTEAGCHFLFQGIKPTSLIFPALAGRLFPLNHGFPVAQRVKKSALQCGRPRFDPWVGKIPWRRRKEGRPAPVFLPGEAHEERSLAGYTHKVAKCQTTLVTDSFTFTSSGLKESI